jgi:hypothetical protein
MEWYVPILHLYLLPLSNFNPLILLFGLIRKLLLEVRNLSLPD